MRGATTSGFSRSEQMILFQRVGVDVSVLCQYAQAADALMRSRSDFRNVGMRLRTSGGRRLMGANEFLVWRKLVETDGSLDIARSIWAKSDFGTASRGSLQTSSSYRIASELRARRSTQYHPTDGYRASQRSFHHQVHLFLKCMYQLGQRQPCTWISFHGALNNNG